MRTSSYAALVAVGVSVLAIVPAATASVVGATNDPSNDAADPHPGRDLTSIGIAYHRGSGVIEGTFRLRGAPTDDAPGHVNLFAGVRTPEGCVEYPAIGFGVSTASGGASDWAQLLGEGQVGASSFAERTGGGTTTQRLRASLDGLRPLPVNCAIATLVDPNDPSRIFDTAGPIDLRRVAELDADLRGVPSSLRRGRSYVVRLRVRNRGDAASGSIRLSIAKRRGLTVSGSRRVRSIAAGRQRTVKLRVTLGSRAASSTRLRITLTGARKARARVESGLTVRRSKGAGGSNGGEGGRKYPRLCTSINPFTGTLDLRDCTV